MIFMYFNPQNVMILYFFLINNEYITSLVILIVK